MLKDSPAGPFNAQIQQPSAYVKNGMITVIRSLEQIIE